MDRTGRSSSLTSPVPTLFTHHTHAHTKGRQSINEDAGVSESRTGEDPKRRHAKCRRRTSDHVSRRDGSRHCRPRSPDANTAAPSADETIVQAEVSSSAFLRKRQLCHFRRLPALFRVYSVNTKPRPNTLSSLITGTVSANRLRSNGNQ